MAKMRSSRTDADQEFDNIVKKHHQRKVRQEQNGKEHLFQNLKAKKGMRFFKEEGELMKFVPRFQTPTNIKLNKNLNDWNWYQKQSEAHSKLLKDKKPDIVCQLNEHWRKTKEDKDGKEEEEKERRRRGEWVYNPVNDDYYWTGSGEPDYGDTFCFEAPNLTKEEEEAIKNLKRKIGNATLRRKKKK